MLLARADRLRPGRHAILFELAGEPWWFVGRILGAGAMRSSGGVLIITDFCNDTNAGADSQRL